MLLMMITSFCYSQPPSCSSKGVPDLQYFQVSELADIIDDIAGVGKIDPTRSNIESYITDIRRYNREYEELTDPVAKQNKLDDIKSLNTSSRPEMIQEYEADSIQIENIKTDINTINCTDALIQIMKDTWIEYLDELDRDMTITNTLLSTNANTVSQYCSDEYGDVVHLGRAIAMIQNSDQYYDINDGCRDSIFIAPRSADLIDDKVDWRIYPNPSAGNFTLEFGVEVSGQIYIYNTNGVVISNYTINDSKNLTKRINDSGVYIVKWILNSGETSSKKMIIIN